jgi:NADPH-dependent 2,4-dienoyl-CoA reductase/sulfur reductase-like enzyme
MLTKQQPQGKAHPADSRHFVIVGGGAAGNAAAEELRRAGFVGRITMISAVPDVPVDRPNLSKDYLDGHAKPEWMPLRSPDWYARRDIELVLDTHVTQIDLEQRTVYSNRETSIPYDKLLLATGGTPRQLKGIPGAELNGIYYLRNTRRCGPDHSGRRKRQTGGIIGAKFHWYGSGFFAGWGRGVTVTVVALEDVPFDRIFGDDIGRMFQQVHEQNGVQFYLGESVVSFTGQDGQVRRVELKSGQSLDADFVVVGVGVVPTTDFLLDSGFSLNEHDQSVRVNSHMQTGYADVYAAGDIARWDDGSAQGVRIEHWRAAEQQGIVAARNMLGENQTIDQRVPFFWTTQWKLTLRYAGYATVWDEIIYWGGTPEQRKFIAFYVRAGNLQAAAGCGYDAELDAIEFILRDQMPLSLDQMHDPSFDLIRYAHGDS